MAARRCGVCNVNWPDNFQTYPKCPRCGNPTARISEEIPLTAEEAEFKKKEFEFEDYYKERGEREYDPMTDKDKTRGRRHVEAIAKAEQESATLLWLRSIPVLDEEPNTGGTE